MKHSLPKILRILSLSLAATATLQATDLLSVDFNSSSSPTQAGFTGQSATSFTHSTASGDLTVAISGQQGNFDYASTTGSDTDIYRDFFFKNNGTMTLTLSGPAIDANTDYELTFWSYYGAEARNTSFAATAGTTGSTVGPIATSNAAPTGLGDTRYSVTGTFTSDGSRVLTFSVTGSGNRPAINGLKIASSGPDLTPPTLLPANIVDDQGGASVNENTLVTYTVTFSEDIDDTTVSSADFSNAGTAPISYGTITETSSGVFAVQITPTAAGTLQLQVPIGATILDTASLSMVTTSAVVDDTSITVTVAPADNTAPTPSPMSFATPPYATSETSIAMVATTASDDAGVEYLFTETSGNPGGDNSGWQGSPTYEDTGLTTGLQYTYTVTARDLSSNQNPTTASAAASATAQTPIIPPVITAPTSRHIVQRAATNVGAIEIEGTYSVGVPERIEARAVVMAGAGNNGTTTAWQTIDAAPSANSFSGTLTNVPAGGWYQLEVRSVISGTPSTAAVMEKIGVGDIYITAGQSNSANFAAGQAPQDDRISARTSVTDSTWQLGTHPLPISNGGGGSVWTWLANRLIAAEDIPIGLVSLGQGGSTASSWTSPGGGNYNARLKPAVKSFPVNGFRAALWHQGETDSINGVTAATHSGYLNAMISQSRIEAGWTIPWYLAEVSYHPSSNLSMQEPIAAGQRLSIHGDAQTFFGPGTDELHLTGGGSLHFSAVGTDAHAHGWADILLGSVTATPENADFEDHGWNQYYAPTSTGPTPLADGNSMIIDILGTSLQLRVLYWRALASSGLNAADGSNGFHNPTTGTYAGAVDTTNSGVLPNMDGKHVAILDGGTAGNYFLQSTRALAKANITYTFTVALGLRDNAATFGTARLEITADGVVVASTSFDKAAIDALHGSDASGTFTDATISWTTGSTVAANQPMAIRVVKEGGAGTVVDFDNARFTATALNDFNSWIDDFGLAPADQDFADDSDNDGLENGLEAWFGTHPGQFTSGLADVSSNALVTTFTHPQNTSPPDDLTGYYEWSPNLTQWYPSGDGPSGGPIVTFVPATTGSTTSVTATASASEGTERIFLRAGVSQD
jgi:hypothetical protein